MPGELARPVLRGPRPQQCAPRLPDECCCVITYRVLSPLEVSADECVSHATCLTKASCVTSKCQPTVHDGRHAQPNPLRDPEASIPSPGGASV
jgi:hypothetical protein